MKHSLILLLMLLVLTARQAGAATAFDDEVPAEVVNQLLGAMFGGQARLYADLPAGFPEFALPEGMTVLVGVDQGGTQRVILKSNFDYQAAIALAYRALMDAGWKLVPRQGTQMQPAGFINPQQPSPQTRLCHDEHGNIDVSIQSGLASTYVNLMRNVIPPGAPAAPSCETEPGSAGLQSAISPQMQQQMQQQMQLQGYVPRLVMPSITEMTAPMGYGGGGNVSPNEWETHAALEGDWDLAQVFRHFADQIADQGWTRDARVTGDVMASGSWKKTVENDIELIGSLTVLVTDDDSYELRFRMIRQGPVNIRMPAMGIRGIPLGR